MKTGVLVVGLGVVVVLALQAVPSVVAQDKKGGAPPAGQQPSSDDMAKMMEMMTQLAAPGAPHKALEGLVGEWTAVGKYRMDPAQPWADTKGTAHNETALGGRFVLLHYKGEGMMGMPGEFEGMGSIGYDNSKKKYVSAWMDSMGTMIMTGEGTADGGGKTFTLKSEFVDPMSNQPSWMKTVYKIEGPDKYVLSLLAPDMSGKEYEMFNLVHTRKK